MFRTTRRTWAMVAALAATLALTGVAPVAEPAHAATNVTVGCPNSNTPPVWPPEAVEPTLSPALEKLAQQKHTENLNAPLITASGVIHNGTDNTLRVTGVSGTFFSGAPRVDQTIAPGAYSEVFSAVYYFLEPNIVGVEIVDENNGTLMAIELYPGFLFCPAFPACATVDGSGDTCLTGGLYEGAYVYAIENN